MSETHVVSALIAKRAELAAMLDDHHEMGKRLTADLRAVDTVLLLFKPDIKLHQIKPKRTRKRFASAGEFPRLVLGFLRTAGRACSTDELTAHIMAERKLNAGDAILGRRVRKHVAGHLRYYAQKGSIRQLKGDDRQISWEVA